jgi:phytoene dehydrogenase-like protein
MQKINIYDIAIIGSGIGGSLIAALNKDKNLILFEKDSNLGGSASTFKKRGKFFNAGATSFVGYEKNHPIYNIFNKINYKPNLIENDIAIKTIQNDKILNRIKDFDTFLENINKIYPHKNNIIFWNKIRDIDQKFWKLKNIYFLKHSLKGYYKTFKFILELLYTYKSDLFKTSNYFINKTLPNISKEYKNFINSQLLITVQSKYENLPLLSMSLGLSYPFHNVFYVKGGMGSIFDEILKEINVHKKEEIKSIKKENEFYKIVSNKGEYLAKNIILNSTIFDSSKLFEDKNIKNYYQKFKFENQSAFTIYLNIKSKHKFLHHYQIILKENITNCMSNSFFISFSDQNDKKFGQNQYSITISTHTKALFWKNLSKKEYIKHKNITQEFILKEFLNYFINIKKDNIKIVFSGTSKTFSKYINRYNCGAKAINFKNILQLPSCNTPFKGLYNIGDTIFAGQGWPGVALGVEVLNKELNNN